MGPILNKRLRNMIPRTSVYRDMFITSVVALAVLAGAAVAHTGSSSGAVRVGASVASAGTQFGTE